MRSYRVIRKDIDDVRDLLSEYYRNKSFAVVPKKKYGNYVRAVMEFINMQNYEYSDMYVYRLWYVLRFMLTTTNYDHETNVRLLQYIGMNHSQSFHNCLSKEVYLNRNIITEDELRFNPNYKCIKEAFNNFLEMIKYFSGYIGDDHIKILSVNFLNDKHRNSSAVKNNDSSFAALNGDVGAFVPSWETEIHDPDGWF